MKIAINKCYGGFSLSRQAEVLYLERKYGADNLNYYKLGFNNSGVRIDREQYLAENSLDYFITTTDCGDEFEQLSDDVELFSSCDDSISFRSDPVLIEVIKELKKEASGLCADIKIVNIPDDVQFYIDNYDGYETIHETHRSW